MQDESTMYTKLVWCTLFAEDKTLVQCTFITKYVLQDRVFYGILLYFCSSSSSRYILETRDSLFIMKQKKGVTSQCSRDLYEVEGKTCFL
jgi:hypothetical protein